MARYGYDFGWRPYVPVARRRAQAQRDMNALRKEGVNIQPVEVVGRKIATSFWGEAWCDHLESFSDYANRLPRGRTYVRNGSVCHLEILEGEIKAKVAGSDVYDVRIRIQALPATKWIAIKKRCSGQVGSLLELLQGKLSSQVMEVVTDGKQGLFPLSREISLNCDCPDWASMCKHVAAVLYGVGVRLDQQPELLFKLRGVDHEELIDADAEAAVSAATSRGRAKRLSKHELEGVFGIDLDLSTGAAASPPENKKKNPQKRANGSLKKKVTEKHSGTKRPSRSSTEKKSTKKKSTETKAAKRMPPKQEVVSADEGTRPKTKLEKKAGREKPSKKEAVESTGKKTVNMKKAGKGTNISGSRSVKSPGKAAKRTRSNKSARKGMRAKR